MYASCNSCRLRATLFPFLVCCAPLLIAANAAAQSPGGGLTTDAEAKPAAAVTAESLEKSQATIAERRQKVEAALKNARSQAAPADRLARMTRQLDRLKYLELTYAQHREELTEAAELRAEAAAWKETLNELRLAGPNEIKPYSVLLSDELRDQLQAQRGRLKTSEAEIAVGKATLQSVLRMREEAETERRKARERLETNSDQNARTDLADEYETAKLDSELFDQMVQLRRAEELNVRLDLEIGQTRVEFLEEKLAVVSKEVVFSKQHLETVLGELDKFEGGLRDSLADMQSRLHEVERRSAESQESTSGEEADDQLQTEMQEGWRLARESHQIQLRMIQQRLRDVVVVRVAWDIRYRLFNESIPLDKTETWKKDVHAYALRMASTRGLLEQQSRDLLASLASQEKRKRYVQHSNPQAAKWIDFQISSQQQISQAYATNLVQVESFEKMLNKLDTQLMDTAQDATATDWLEMGRASLAAAWDYEITSVDDRPITVKKLAKGFLLLLIGIFLSRRLSRFFGNRMLPRLGMNSGVSTAFQSILFYALLTMFGFVSLELANVPITVFTFLGGAVAIGVGFGSQNILNNFISGLILLAEQPIRVGDLVEVNGLYGTVEKIGARSTRVKTGANLEMIVPNSKFLEDNVTNWTLSDTRMRTCVSVGVAYGSRTDLVEELLRKAVIDNPHTLHEPEPIILFKDFADNSLVFEIHFWIQMRTIMQAHRIESDLRFAIDRMFREADICIAFPQRDIHFNAEHPIEINLRQAADTQMPLRPKRAA